MFRRLALVAAMMPLLGCAPQSTTHSYGKADAVPDKEVVGSANASESVPLSRAPSTLRKILALHDAHVDLRQVPSCKYFNPSEFGYYWRIPATSEIIQSHIRLFYLMLATDKDADVLNMLAGMPPDWPDLKPEGLTWYTQGLGDDGNVGSWHVMGVDRTNEMLYFFVSSWDYAP